MLYEGDEDFCALSTGWSPDGERLAVLNFMEAADTPSEIWVMNIDGSDEQLIFEVESSMEPMALTWDPLGKEIIFIFNLNDGQPRAWLLNTQGNKEPKPLDENDLERMQIWRWLPNYWPQWAGLQKS